MGTQTDRVRFNVRGKMFETTATTLASAGRDSMFGAMFDDEWNLQPREVNEEYFIDRDPDCFSVLLNLLGTGNLHVPPSVSEKLLYREAHYYGLLDQVRSAKISKFDCNWLKLMRSVRDEAPDEWTLIRASPDGGCAVAHKNVVRVYDWMLEEYPPLNLDYKSVRGIEWIDSENIVMGCQNVSRGGAGMGVFSSSTGELSHKFHLYDGKDDVNDFAEALCFNSDGKIFASCRGESSSGIGVWDQVTGKQIDFFDLPLAHTNKIQWVNGRNCLFVSTLFPGESNSINLLDFREKSIVWSMCMGEENFTFMDVADAIPLGESNSICLLNRFDHFGYADLRSTGENIGWCNYPSGYYNRYSDAKCCYPKLTFHAGQLFCSMKDEISVYYGGPEHWVSTSKLGRSQGGFIRDFSIGGDRLFALHSEENVIDVWETPSPPVMKTV